MEDIEYLLLNYLSEHEIPTVIDKFPLYAISHSPFGLKEFNKDKIVQELLDNGYISSHPGTPQYSITDSGRDLLVLEKIEKEKIEKETYARNRKTKLVNNTYWFTFVFSLVVLLIAVTLVIFKFMGK